jgi:hypothetical protein
MRDTDSTEDYSLMREIERILKLYGVSPRLVPVVISNVKSDRALKELVALFIASPCVPRLIALESRPLSTIAPFG